MNIQTTTPAVKTPVVHEPICDGIARGKREKGVSKRKTNQKPGVYKGP